MTQAIDRRMTMQEEAVRLLNLGGYRVAQTQYPTWPHDDDSVQYAQTPGQVRIIQYQDEISAAGLASDGVWFKAQDMAHKMFPQLAPPQVTFIGTWLGLDPFEGTIGLFRRNKHARGKANQVERLLLLLGPADSRFKMELEASRKQLQPRNRPSVDVRDNNYPNGWPIPPL